MAIKSHLGITYTQIVLLLFCCYAQDFSEAISFQPGISFQYHYMLDLKIKHISQPSMPETNLKIDANVQTYLLWRKKSQPEEQLVYVQIQDFTIHRRNNSNKENNSVIKHLTDTGNLGRPVLFHWISGKLLGLYGTREDNSRVLDLKRGLVSLFQFQNLSGIHTEEDVSGACSVTYQISEGSIKKTKDLSSCTATPFGFQTNNSVFGVSLNSTSNSELSHIGGIIQTAVSEESHIVYLRVTSLLGSEVASRQHMELTSSNPGPAEIHEDSVQKILELLPEKYQKIEIASHPQRRNEGSHLLKNYLKDSQKKQTKLDISRVSTTKLFNAMVKMFRHAKKRDILQLLQKASGELVPFYIDAAVGAQSSASLAALSEFLDFSKKKQVSLHEKFLYSAAFVPHPSKELLNLVLEKLKGKVSDPVIMETGIVISGAIVGKMCKMKLCELKDVEIAKATLVEGLHEAEEESEINIYLVALKNAQLPETIPLLLQYTQENGGAVSRKALAALQSFPTEIISTKEVKSTLKRILHQTYQEYDKASRLIAAEILLVMDHSQMDLINMILVLENMNTEASKLLLSKIQSGQQIKNKSCNTEKTLLKDKYLYNYNKLAQSGRSTFFSGPLTATKDVSSTYGLDLLFTESGLLKQSISDITLFGHNNHLKAMQVSLEAEGLESLIGDGAEDNDEDKDATVGMSAVLFDVQLRPVVFFQGYMDLVSKVFSSSGEPMSVVKGNVLLIDYLQRLPMQSGLQAIVEYQGGLGLEVSANIDVSIWEQESKTNINTKASLVFEFTTELDTSFFQADIKAQVDAETAVDFDSVMKFSAFPMLMCLELRQNHTPYRETYIVSESLPEKSMTYTVRKGRKATLWGRDFPFHNSNSEMCRSLLTADEQ
ncbi:microsomal triglyceride transfer protein [Xenopus laevis]|uniref:Microsomal triglyceride transfer protein n=1 Tax=Xenopus laevis TaxID=8355 RepID=A0A8J0TUE0_XENLA|nr:microsomal triglyceride transfer protein [Xenopus laevis]OCT59812.1 hypothetical protein XELAEV_18000685mg [Xenopus laevis]